MADPPVVGTPESLFFFSGKSSVFEANRPILEVLGTITYFGDDPGAAAVDFQSQVALGYEILLGFLHTLRLVQAEGVDIEAFAGRAEVTMRDYLGLLSPFAKAIKNAEYGPDLGPLHVQAALFDDLIGHRESQGVETVRMREVKHLMDRRIADGHGGQGFSSLFELLGKR
ncbi:3-hydroxyisobutyrate dehydrogenase-like beta-hydroxyacid dehydrogenase [Algoriphagus sp. 4150]|uniref:imine reductase family protein n=1 Tax=Algoriphagus sp. 4150 TaxID=2817756 RepID=UPI0028628416|nr:hypothetical protein [Algoriphagus sp. 4150]MDR7129735.1 3-hydroxyisobutyrate dehydrogenase-like beta-hydroxyacid dehydrogenase [Algoriphagus sp. 4150]